MKYLDEFRNPQLAEAISNKINSLAIASPVNFMEICGTHTHAISRYGIRDILPENISLLSGPGCPVCVTDIEYIDMAIALAGRKEMIITTFGDLFRVPGSKTSLQEEKSMGADVRVVYSSLEALDLARRNPRSSIVFLGVGFETTAPGIAASIKRAEEDNISNFYVLSGLKTLPGALSTLAEFPDLHIDGLIAPGHLSMVTGTALYKDIIDKYNIPSVITGFEPLDILGAIHLLTSMFINKTPAVINEYDRAVRDSGNPKAMKIIQEVFEPDDASWRGLGVISGSGLKRRDSFSLFDALRHFDIDIPKPVYPKGCICGKILTGVAKPFQCPHFGNRCKPDSPVGACMVSSEGTCAAYYRYKKFQSVG